jgi:hypothetical protein
LAPWPLLEGAGRSINRFVGLAGICSGDRRYRSLSGRVEGGAGFAGTRIAPGTCDEELSSWNGLAGGRSLFAIGHDQTSSA